MHISRLKLKNWRNFKLGEVENLPEAVYILGPNASGKSNFLDAIRFLRDVSKPRGGGLQDAIERRGGIKKLRCLHARNDTEILIEAEISDESNNRVWKYELGFNIPPKGVREPKVTREIVTKYEADGTPKVILNRPEASDREDDLLLRETHIEQISANAGFRDLADFFSGISYVHLVPQLLKFGDQIGGRVVADDPFGQEFMLRIAGTQQRTRDARLKRIEVALKTIVPQLEDLTFVKDEITGYPHLEIRFKHHRPQGAKQREDQFSDGTLRLMSILWLLQERGSSPLLLEEPELSLNEEIVAQLPRIMSSVKTKSRNRRQFIITTHSHALLSNSGINPDGVIVLSPSDDGSSLRGVLEEEKSALSVGLTVADVILPNARKVQQLNFNL
ncbi:AAA family ATPase [Epibacterium ulvae]|uniref:AAA family ATPase n=1 Tax=Epibacterium ulvae TaxID=1156985 RepID=UPI0024926407|nr:ATP-binding protein [Epibacterium ulvae]